LNFKRPIDRRVIDCLFTFAISLFIGCRSGIWILMRISLIFASIQANANNVDKVYRFDIPSQSLVESLGTLSQTTERLFLFPYDLVENKKSKHLYGFYTAQQALDVLLTGTNLQGELSNNNTFLVKPILVPEHNDKSEKKGDKKLKTQKTIIASIFAMLFSTAQSAEVSDENNEQKAKNSGIEVIQVTARKRSEPLQEVPISVSAFSASAIEKSNISRVEEITSLSPTVTFDTKRDFGTSSVRIRGVGTLVLDSGVESSVATVIDGVVMSQGGSALNELPDIQRVEVLNGPQGTLFGKNASVGLINIITKNPNLDEMEGDFGVRVAQDGDYKVNGSISAPIDDDLAYRFSGYYRDYEGNVENIYTGNNVNGVEAFGMRTKLHWLPTDDLSIMFAVDYSDQDTGCCQRILREDTGGLTYDSSLLPPVGPNAYDGPHLTGTIADITGLNISKSNDQVSTEREPKNTAENYGVSITLDWDIGDYTFTSLSSSRHFDTVGTRDNDETPLPLNNYQSSQKDSDWVSQEFRISSPETEYYDYMLGLYYYSAESSNLDEFERIISVSLDGRFDQPDTPFIDHFVQSGFAKGKIENTNTAVFGNLNIHPTEELTIFTGFRYLEDEIEGTVSGTRVDKNPSVDGDNNASPALIDVGPLNSKESDTAFIGRVGLQYKFDEDIMGYASYSTGFKGRGYSTEFFVSEDRFNAEPVAPEESTSYEIGLKTTLFDNTLRFNTTYFNTEIEGFQLTFRDLDTLINSLNSVEKVSTEGVEIDFSWVPTDHITINGGLAFIDAIFDDYANSNNGDLSGTTLPNAPEFKGVISARYDTQISEQLNGYAQLAYRYQSEVNFLQDGSGFEQYADQGSYGIADLSFGVSTLDDKYSVNVFVKNLTDEFYVTGISPNGNAGGGFVLHALARDYTRYIGASFSMKF